MRLEGEKKAANHFVTALIAAEEMRTKDHLRLIANMRSALLSKKLNCSLSNLEPQGLKVDPCQKRKVCHMTIPMELF